MKTTLRNLSIAISLLILASCSTTSALEEGETLYTGIRSLNYVDQGDKPQTGDSKYEGGVIVAIADAAERISDAFNGISSQEETPSTPTNTDSLRQAKAIEKEVLDNVRLELDAVFAAAPNNSVFGSPYHRLPLPVGLWVYNKWNNTQKGFGRFMYKTLAKDPVLISSVNPETRIKIANNVLRNYGFFHGRTDFSLTHSKHNPRKAKINYNIHTGRLFRIDSVEYLGYSGRADSLIQASREATLLRRGAPFSALTLSQEQTRLANLLRNQGYYYYQATSSTFKADTLQKPYQVQLRMQPSPMLRERYMRPYYIGRTHVTVLTEQDDSISRQEQMTRRNSFIYNYSGTRRPLHPGVLRRNILHRHGNPYRQDDQEKTQQLLGDLGIFSQLSMRYTMRDTTQTCDTLDLWINAILDKRYNAEFELNVTEHNNERIGPGMSFGLKKKNAFRRAEQLTFKLFGSYQWKTNLEKDQKGALFNSYEVGSKLSLDIPRLVFPGMDPRRLRFPATTSITFSADWLNRSGYYNLFQLGASLCYTWRKNLTSRHEFTPLSLTFDKLIRSTAEFDSILIVSPSLAVSMQDRFVPAMQYTYAFTSASYHRNPISWQFTIKEAGALTSALTALSGQKLSEKDKRIFNNPFAQYLKVTSELRYNIRLHGQNHLVTRLMGGIAYAYGNSRIIPYSDQYYVGGANSVRAFPIRTVGPGRFQSRGRKFSYMDQTGDLKLEGNIEYRFPISGALSGAYFVDAGNVWLLRSDPTRQGGTFHLPDLIDDLALGTGAGIRYDLDFLVVRLDMGVALHDPQSQRKGYFDTGRLWDRFAFHFAIGYPF